MKPSKVLILLRLSCWHIKFVYVHCKLTTATDWQVYSIPVQIWLQAFNNLAIYHRLHRNPSSILTEAADLKIAAKKLIFTCWTDWWRLCYHCTLQNLMQLQPSNHLRIITIVYTHICIQSLNTKDDVSGQKATSQSYQTPSLEQLALIAIPSLTANTS